MHETPCVYGYGILTWCRFDGVVGYSLGIRSKCVLYVHLLLWPEPSIFYRRRNLGYFEAPQVASRVASFVEPIRILRRGHVLFRDDIYGVVSPFIAALLTALVYLTVSRMLIFQRCPWSIVLRWVPLSLVAGIPFVYPVFKLGEGWLGNFWFWGFHILLWYTAVSYVLDKMANSVLQPAPASGHG